MENKEQNPGPIYQNDGVNQSQASGMLFSMGPTADSEALSSQNPLTIVQGSQTADIPLNRPNILVRLIKRADIILAVLLLLSMIGVLIVSSSKDKQTANNTGVGSEYSTQEIPLDDFTVSSGGVSLGGSRVTINGLAELKGGLVVTPSLQPSAPKDGQLYYDQTSNQFAYYNGTQFVTLGSGVESVGSITGQVTLGGGLAAVGNQLVNAGVLSLGGQGGAIVLGNGFNMAGNTLQNTGILNVIAGTDIAVANDGNGNVTISNVGAGTGTVTSSGGTSGILPLFTSAQNIEDSIVTQTGMTVTITGDLSVVTGGLSLSNALTVSNGGTGTASLAANGVIVGNGTSALSSVAAGGAGLCLLSTGGAPNWAACPGGSGVSSLNGLTGGLSIANASAAGVTITIDDATSVSKGIASFNATNFSVAGGAVNTIQNINSGATPTFAGVNTNNINPNATLTVGGTAETLILQGDGGTVLTATAGANTTTVGFTAPTADVNLNFPALSTGSYELCTDSGNCLGGGAGGANTALSNLTGVAINTTLLPGSAGAVHLGSATLPFGDLFLAGTSGTPGTNNFRITGASTSGTRTITIPDASGTLCLTTGNCAGTGGGVTTAGGSIGTLPVFNGTQTLADSLVSQSAGVVTVNGHLSLSAGNQYQINGTQISSANLSNDSNLAKLAASQTFAGNTNAFQNGSNSINAFNVQNAIGSRVLTVDTSNGEVELGVGSALDGRLVFHNVSNANTVTFVPGTPTNPRTITLPDDSGILCLNTGNCAGAGATLQTSYNFSVGGTTPKIKVDSTLLGVDIQDADAPTGADLLVVRESNGGGLGQAMFAVNSTGQVTLQNGTNSTTAFRLLSDGGTAVLTGNTTNGYIILGQSSTLDGTLVFNNATNGNQVTLTSAAATAPQSILLPNASGTVCLTSGNCAGIGGTGDILQGGNSFTASMTIGTNDAFDLNLETTGITRLTIESDGSQVTLANDVDLMLQGSSAYISNPQGTVNSEVFGSGASTDDVRNVVVGNGATITGNSDSVAIGYNASGRDNTVTIGTTSNCTNNSCTAIGYATQGAFQSVALGNSANANTNSSIALGQAATTGATNSIALGTGATTTASNQLAIGSSSSSITQVVIGNGVTNAAPAGFTLQGTSGSGSNITGAAVTIAAGQGTGSALGGNIVFQSSLAGGAGASLNSLTTLATLSTNSLTMGTNLDVLLQGATAYISNTQTQSNSEAFGLSATVGSNNALAVGNTAASSSNGAVALGASTWAQGIASLAVGTSSYAANAASIALGAASITTAANQLVIGANDYSGTAAHISQVYIGDGVTSATPNGFTLQGTGGSGSNIAGASVSIAGGRGTGTGNGGDLNFQIADPGGSGSSLNALATVLSLSGVNGAALLQNTTNSAVAFQIQDTAAAGLFTADTTARSGSGGNLIKIGNSTGTDGATTILQLDGASADPTSNLAALNGGLYYNTTTNKVSLIENGVVKIICNTTDLGCGTGTVTLQTAYANSSNPEISLSTAATAGITIRDNAAPIAGNLLEVQSDGGGTTYFGLTTAALTLGSNVDIIMQGATAYISNPQTHATSEAFGLNASVSDGKQVAVGYGATVSAGEGGIAIGHSASVVSQNGIAIGENADAGFLGVGIGGAASGQQESVAIGNGANVGGHYSVGIGAATNITHDHSISLGHGATTTAVNQLVIGSSSHAISQAVVGNGVTNAAPTGFTLQGTSGSGSNIAGATVNIAAGRGTGSALGGNIVFQSSLGGGAGASLNSLTTLATLSTTSLTTGTNLDVLLQGATAYISNTQTQSGSEVFGLNAVSGSTGQTVIGNGANGGTGADNIAIGNAAVVAGSGASVAIGNGADVRNNQSVGIGAGVQTSLGGRSTAIGYDSSANGTGALALGYLAEASNNRSIALGYGAQTTALNQLVIGSDTDAANISLVVVGSGVTDDDPNGFTLQGTSGSGSNIAGASVTVAGGQSTGSAAGGTLNFQISGTGGAGASLNALKTVASFSGASGAALFQNATNSTSAFQIQNTAGTQLFNVSTVANPGNLVANGSLEQNTTNWVAKGGASISRVTSQHYVGVASLQTVTTAAIGDGARYNVTLSSSTQYTASIYLRLASGTFSNNLSIGYSSDGVAETDCKTGETVKTGGWLVANCTFTTGTVSGTPYFYWEQADATARTVYVDAFQIVAGADIGAYYDGKIDVGGLIFNGPLAIQNDTDSNSVFQVQDAQGQSLFGIDAVNKRVGVNLIQPTATFEVASLSTTSVATTISQHSSSTQDILRLRKGSGTVLTVAHTGATTLANNTNSADAFRVLDSGSDELLGVDSTNSIVRLLGNNTGHLSGDALNEWESSSSTLPADRAAGAATTVNGYLYQIGGCDSGGGLTATVYYARTNGDGSIGSWNPTTSIPQAMCGGDATSYNGYIYVNGGTGASATSRDIYYAKPNADGTITSWSTQNDPTNYSIGLKDNGLAAYNGYLYITAGWTDDGADSRNRTLYRGRINSDGSVPSMTAQANWLPNDDFNAGETIITNGRIYVFGSANYDKFYYGSIGADGAASASTLATGTTDARKYAAIAVMNGYMYVIAGGTTPTDTVQYGALGPTGDIASFSSSDTTTLPDARWLCSKNAPVVNGYVYLFGCADSGDLATDTVFYASGPRVKVGGSLDLVGYSGDSLAEAGSGGQLTAGNTHIAGLLTVTGNATFKDGATVNNNLTVQAQNNSSAAFAVLNAAAVPQFSVDSSNSRVYIGNPVADSTGALLVLDTKDTSGDPTGVDGGMYYNSNATKFRCRENGAWKNCRGLSQNLTLFGLNGNGNASGWDNMPAAETEFMVGVTGIAVGVNRMRYDLTDVDQIRLQVNVEFAGSTNAEIRIQYSTDQSTWNYIDNGNTGLGQNVSTTGLKVSSWADIASGAKGDVYLRLTGINGNAVADPEFGLIQLQVR